MSFDPSLSEYVEGLLSKGALIKISSTSNPKNVAGKIAHSAREGDIPAALAIGAVCINQAIKSISIARQYLEKEDISLKFQPAFRNKDQRASIALFITKQPKSPAPAADVECVELSISAHSKPRVAAGALAARVRESIPVALLAIGVDAVSNAVLTIGNARLYLEQDSMDIRAQPRFVTVQKDGRELNALRFDISSEAI